MPSDNFHGLDAGISYTEIGRAQSELQSLRRISYAVFCLKKKKIITKHGHEAPLPWAILTASHPVPDATTLASGAALLAFVDALPYSLDVSAPPAIYTYCLTLSLPDALPI